jgi:hypothetical protein
MLLVNAERKRTVIVAEQGAINPEFKAAMDTEIA